METPAKRQAASILESVSSQILIKLLITSVSVLVLLASIFLLNIAHTQDNELLDEIEYRLLLVLENNGLTGLTVATKTFDQSLLPPREDMDFAVWRSVDDTRFLLAETADGIADAMQQERMESAASGDNSYLLRWPDVATVSAVWEVSYRDVELGIALHAPTTQMKTARRIIVSLCCMGAIFVLAMILVNMNHQRRYANGLAAINETLDLFAQGQTDMRVSENPVAPEIDRLAKLLNDALSRIDTLTNGLRYMSAHLAHEINTPLQKIRMITSQIADEASPDQRKINVAEIDRILENARARQQNLMQLFRLEAGEIANLNDHFDLGDLIESVHEDFEDVLKNYGRSVTLDVTQGVEILGNRPLFELVVTNLLINAAKYAVPDSHIRIILLKDADSFYFTVSNDGSVFPEAVRAGSFRRFIRADDSRGSLGAGLGLNLIFAICQAHVFSVGLPNDPDKAIIEIKGQVTRIYGAAD